MTIDFNHVSAIAILLVTFVINAPASAFFTHNDKVPENKEIIVMLHGLGRNTTSM
jgi:hypothetical protein